MWGLGSPPVLLVTNDLQISPSFRDIQFRQLNWLIVHANIELDSYTIPRKGQLIIQSMKAFRES